MAANSTHILSQELEDKIYQLVAEENKGLGINAINLRQNELINTLQGLRESIRTQFEKTILNQSETHLDLYDLGLTVKEFEGIADLLTLTKVTSLNLGFNGLDGLGADDLTAVLGALPATLTSLNLMGNDLDGLGPDGLIAVFGALPATLTSLNLGGNGLGKLGADGLTAVIGTLPAILTSLDLAYNHFGELGADGLTAVFDTLPATLTSLKLNLNHLGDLGADGLTAVLGALPAIITSLDLENNYLDGLGREDLKEAFEPLRNRDVMLILDSNGLSDESINDIQKMMLFGGLTKSAKRGVAFFSPAGQNRDETADSAIPSSLFSQAPSSSNKGKEKEESVIYRKL